MQGANWNVENSANMAAGGDLPSSDSRRQSAPGWTDLLSDASIELISEQASKFAPVANSFGPGTLVFLPHIAGKPLEAQISAASLLISRGFRPVAHLSARNFRSHDEVDQHIRDLSASGVKHCLAVGGVPSVTPNALVANALELIDRKSFRNSGFETVFLAGHPEGIADVASHDLRAALASKIEMLRAQGRSVEIATQFAFDGVAMARWAAELKAKGISVPIRFGVAGVTSLPKLIKFAMLCGVGASLNVLKQRTSSIFKVMTDQDPQDVLEALSKTMATVDAPLVKVHFFPFGGWEKTAHWLASKR